MTAREHQNQEQIGGLVTLKMAVALLKADGVVAVPTETVYGLAARASSAVAVSKVYAIKARPADNPLIVHVASIEQAQEIAEFSDVELRLARRFWPGPLTLVLPHRGNVPAAVTAGLDTVAVRMPRHEVTLQLIKLLGEPLVGPSANPSGRPSPTCAQHVLNDYDGTVPVLDGGVTSIGLESTVIRIIGDVCTILRPGAVTMHDISLFGIEVRDASPMTSEQVHSPGTRHRHYAPQTPMRIFSDAVKLYNAMDQAKSYAILAPYIPFRGAEWRPVSAHTLYAELRRADAMHVDEILVLCTGQMCDDKALMDRLGRAAGVNLIGEGT